MCQRLSTVYYRKWDYQPRTVDELETLFHEVCHGVLGAVLIVQYEVELPWAGFDVVFGPKAVLHGYINRNYSGGTMGTKNVPVDRGAEEWRVRAGTLLVGIGCFETADNRVLWNIPQEHRSDSPALVLHGEAPHAFANQTDAHAFARVSSPFPNGCVANHAVKGGNSHPVLPLERADRCPAEFNN